MNPGPSPVSGSRPSAPAPPNLTFVAEAEWRQRVKAGYYDVVIAQNESNAIDAADGDAARLLICHNRRSYLLTTIHDDTGRGQEKYNELLSELGHLYNFVFISESKRKDYGLPGRVILPGIDVDAWGGYRGDTPCIIRVGNTMRQRDLMFDVDFQDACCAGLPTRVVGTNPLIPESVPTKSLDDLHSILRDNRCYLHVSREAYEDGYNLAMLEAMACGMPVVSLANPTSPITNGEDGFTSYDADELRGHLQQLLEDPDLARKIGACGRATIAESFPMSRFVTQWREAILEAADTRSGMAAMAPPVKKQRLGVPFLLSYVSSPHTTSRYIREAIRKDHVVVSCGMDLPDTLLTEWGFSHPIPDYPRHDFDVSQFGESEEVTACFPDGFKPALLLWVDSGQPVLENGLKGLKIPKVGWFIDTHIANKHRVDIAKQFDFVYLAQRGQIQEYLDAGIKHVRWMPLGCAPELYTGTGGDRIYDVAFVGSVASESGNKRQRLLERVRERFPNHFIKQCWPHEMAAAYSQARIIVNMCVNDDVNMRVFEALAAGALLITDDANGLGDLFDIGHDLVVYQDEDDAIAQIEHYLADDDARERIARQGRDTVLSAHTYSHRVQAILNDVECVTGPLAVPLLHHDAKSDKDYYRHPRRELLQAIPFTARRVLDVGCGAGALGKVLKEERGVEEVCGIEFMEEAYERACHVLDKVYLGNIEEMILPFEDGHFDCIVCGDVLEHLVLPEAVLRKLDRVLAPHGLIVISVPNARNFEVLHMLGAGCWTYYEQGIMDATHLRFYTRRDLATMIEAGGMRAAEILPLNSRPANMLPISEDGSVTVGNITIENIGKAAHAEMLGYQLLAIACKSSWDPIKMAHRAMENGQYDMALNLALDARGVDEIDQLHIVARAYGRLGSLDKSASAYELLLEKTDAPLIVGDYGILLVAMNKPDRAAPLLEKALASAPELDRVEGALGLLALQKNDLERAFTHMERAMMANFDHKGLVGTFLDVARALDRLDDALPVLTAYVDFYPGNLDLKVNCAEVNIEIGRHADAREQLDMVLLFDAGHEKAQSLLDGLNAPRRTEAERWATDARPTRARIRMDWLLMQSQFLKSPETWRTILAAHAVPENIELGQSRSGSPTLRVDGIQFHSRYSPEEEALRLVDSAELASDKPVLVIGSGLGHHVLALLARGHEVAVLEPDEHVLKLAVEGPLAEAACRLGQGAVPAPGDDADFDAFLATEPHVLIHPPTAQRHSDYVEKIQALVATRALAGKRLSVAVVGPMFGGSLPIAGYLANAFARLGHHTHYVNHEDAWPLYEKIGTTVKGDRPSAQLTDFYTGFLSEWSYAQVAEFNPEICIVLAQAPVAPNFAERLRKCGIITAFWYVENWRHLPYWRDIAAHYDYFFHIQPGEFEEKLNAVGCRHHAHVQTACDPTCHQPVALNESEQEKYRCDLSFAGAGYYNRVEVFKGLGDYDFKIWGVNWSERYLRRHLPEGEKRFDSETFMKIVAGSKINLNLHSSSSHSGVDPASDAINPRVFEIAAAGGFQLCDPCVGLDRLFDFDSELPVYRDLRELREKIDYYLAHPEAREAMAKAAQKRVLAEHTYEQRAEAMLQHIFEAYGATLMKRGIRAIHSVDEIKARLEKDSDLYQWLATLPGETPFTYEVMSQFTPPLGGERGPAEAIFTYMCQVKENADAMAKIRR